ncbi:hypothetical protein CTEN210_14987 [Chaetoceros tenuissimus]|uniref:Uncharacterized protein n=1 Tax=Chaetoceros tenuissimus TaxID=426638 RepID=A0AAD3D603_9STRA|nr:hypothetical protein CTEN210_14987 [Chaetoceros tenuissimus]
MKSVLLLSLLAQPVINCNAWIQFPKGQGVEVRVHMSEERGLFESLSPLPVYEWVVDPSSSEWDFGFHACVGDECEDCEIPTHYKDDSVDIDVLEFLGIKRAEPLRVKRSHGLDEV